MRKIFTSLMLALFVLAGYARQISPSEAEAAAADFFRTSGRTLQSSAKPLKVKGQKAEASSEPYYIYNAEAGNGFVIISGDDRSSKILGYSDKGAFDANNLPPQLKSLLDSYAENLEKRTAGKDVHDSWKKSAPKAGGEGILLETANWGQGYPYNTECPTIDGEHALTGCVATAMAIVMKYHNWPEGYDWAAMPMNTEEDPINFEENNDLPALAKIMHDAGEAVFMQYGLEESGAYLDWIGHRLQSVFHYSPDCQYIGGDHFEKDEWETMLKGNIDKGFPVIYDGYGTGGHHAFVLDGYDSSDLYHVNWGWNGLDNGYYALAALEPAEGWGFSEYNGMIMNIEPDHEMSDYSECFTDYGYLWSLGASRRAAVMNVSVEDIKKGEPFHLFNSALTVTPGFKGQIGVAIVDKEDNIKEVLRTVYRTTFAPGTDNASVACLGIMFYDLIPTCDIEPTDRLQLVSKHDNDDKYKVILGTMEWPSSRPIVGNTPERSTVTFNMEDGTKCRYLIEESGMDYTDLPVGVTEIPVYYGARITFFFEKEDLESDNPIHLAIHGNMYGGSDEYWTGTHSHAYPIEIYGDKYEVEVKILNLHAETIHLEEAGTLKDKLAHVDGINIGSLTVSGKMNALDFWYIRDNCPSLQKLDLKDVDVEEITAGDGAWVPDGMVHQANTIPYRALPGMENLEELILPTSLTAIDGFSFMVMKLTSISIPEGVKNIGRDAFWSNTMLEAVEVLNPEPPTFDYTPFEATMCPTNGILFVPEGSKEKYEQAEIWKDFKKIVEGPMPNPLKAEITVDNLVYECYVDEAQLIGYVGEPVDVVIPEKITSSGLSYNVIGIKEYCFNNCLSLRSIDMPNTISALGYGCFNGCENLESVKLSTGITKIQYETFRWCYSLRDFEITPNIQYIGEDALYGAGISKMFIPKTYIPDPYSNPFGYNSNLENFEVEEGHEHYKEVDGLLYRITESGLVLESVPGGKSGKISTAPECVELMRGSVNRLDNVTDLVLNEGLKIIDTNAITSTSILHITLPSSVTIQEYGIYDNYMLESLTFHGMPTIFSKDFAYCANLKHIYVNSEEDMLKLDDLFFDEYETLNIYHPALEKNYGYSGEHTIFVPGGSSERFRDAVATKVIEMWEYKIDRKNNRISIIPNIEGLEIDKVTVNGRVVAPENGVYYIAEDSSEMKAMAISDTDLDVKVEYTLHGRQSMTTHYSPEFNATIPDSVVTGIEDLFAAGSAAIDIYSVDGSLMVKNGDKAALQQLAPGVYIIRKGGKGVKIAVK